MKEDEIVEIGARAIDPDAFRELLPEDRDVVRQPERQFRARLAMRSALTAYSEAGRAIVPTEPTEAMVKAAIAEADKQHIALDELSPPLFFAPIYRAMLAAAKET